MRSVKRAGDLLKKAHGRKVKRPRKEKACATAVGHALTRVQAVEQRRVIVARLDCKLRDMLPDGGCEICRAALLSVSLRFLRRHRATACEDSCGTKAKRVARCADAVVAATAGVTTAVVSRWRKAWLALGSSDSCKGQWHAENRMLCSVLICPVTNTIYDSVKAAAPQIFGISRQRVARLCMLLCDAARCGIDWDESLKHFHHTPSGIVPHNKASPEVIRSIRSYLDIYTKLSPDGSTRTIADAEQPDKAALIRAWEAKNPELADEVCGRTVRTYIDELMEAEGVKLHGYGTDHNVCDVCEKYAEDTLKHYVKKMVALEAGDIAEYTRCDALEAAAVAKHRTHLQNDWAMREEIDRQINVSKAAFNAQVHRASHASDAVDPRVACKPNSWPGHLVLMFDDMNALKYPKKQYESSRLGLERVKVDLNGCYNCTHDRQSNLYAEGLHTKDRDHLLNALLLHILMNVNGEQSLVLVFDCGPLGYNAAVGVHLAKLLLRLNVCTSVTTMYFWLNHGK